MITRNKLMVLGLLCTTLGATGPALAEPIFYTAVDLPDTEAGDLWQYNYEIANTSGATLELFEIVFDVDDYDFILEGDPPDEEVTAFTVADGWFGLVLPDNPDFGEDGLFTISFGEFDLLPIEEIAQDIGSAITGFSITFIWNGVGTPGSQDVNAYIYDDFFAEPLTFTTQARAPSSVPEPSTVALLGLGVGLLIWQRRRSHPVSQGMRSGH